MLDDDPYSTDPMPLEPADQARDVAAANPRDDIFRCLCGVCDPQEPDERLCCHSVARVVEMCNSAAVQCITQHPLLRDICLRRELLVVYAPQFCRYDQHFRRLNPQDHRCIMAMDQDIAAAYDMLTPEQKEILKTYNNTVWPLSLAIQLSILGFLYEGQGRTVLCIHCNGRSSVPKTSGPQDVLLEHLLYNPVCTKPIGEIARQPTDLTEKQAIEENITSARQFYENKGIPKEVLDKAADIAKRTSTAESVIRQIVHLVSSLQKTPRTSGTSTALPPGLEEEYDGTASDGLRCKICNQADADAILIPCSQAACCLKCSARLLLCPMCGVAVESYRRITA
ncbi:baculoviral IAP repeat-containing protein 7-B-like [Ornithodoros turicata]|uniref:baculoviral IAP repeat-containing protein 7-B-like n=1 Tax=Ornithodoros turicata TaxID=34597 RepID=UPI0031386E76